MKRILVSISILTTLHTYAQFSIRRNPVFTNSIDILYTAPPNGQGLHPVQFFEFGLQVTNPNGALSAKFTKGDPLASLEDAFHTKMGFGDGRGVQTFSWTSTGLPDYSLRYNFPATEVVLGTVAFSGNFSGAIVNAIDYQADYSAAHYGGVATEEAVWTMQVDSWGNEVTNYTNLFYQSQPASGTPGSSPPSIVREQGFDNQILMLQATPLPLKLLSFTAKQSNSEGLLNWTVSEQQNTNSFIVERSMDGMNYSKVGTVAAAGNYAGKQTYSFTDANAASGTNYYRLKMVDIDGKFTYSPVRTVNFDGAALSLQITPNPTQGVCYVKGLSQPAVVKLLDVNGKVVWMQNGVTSSSPINVTSLARALYFVQVIQNGQILSTLKLIKE